MPTAIATYSALARSQASKGIKYIKINKIDNQGNDNTLSLYALEKLVVPFDDFGNLEFVVQSITEFPTYYLYRVNNTVLGYNTDTFKSPTLPSSSVSNSLLTAGSSSVGPFYNYTNTTGSISSGGLYNFGNGGYSVTVSCSFSASATVVTHENFYLIFTGSSGETSKILFSPRGGSPGSGSYTGSFSFVPTPNQTLGVAFGSSSVNINFNLPSITFTVTQDTTSSIDGSTLNHSFSASAYTGSNKLYINDGGQWSGAGLSSSIDTLSYFNSSSGKYIFGDTPNIKIYFTASVNFENGLQGSFELRRNASDSILGITTVFAPGTYYLTGSFEPLEADQVQLFIFDENSSGIPFTGSNIQWSFTQSQAPRSEDKQVLLSPYLTGKFIDGDCDVLMNNVFDAQPNTFYQDVDYSTNGIIAVNFQNILDGTATPSTVKEYYYHLKRHSRPRYEGSKLEGALVNEFTLGDISYGKDPVINNQSIYFAYFDYLNDLNFEYKDKTSAHIIHLIDEQGNIYQPSSTGLYNDNIQYNFGKKARIIPNKLASGSIINFSGLKDVINTTKYPVPVLFSQTGSGFNSASKIEFSNFSTEIIPNYSLNVYTNTYVPGTSPFILDLTSNNTSPGSGISSSFSGDYNQIVVTSNKTKFNINVTLYASLIAAPAISSNGAMFEIQESQDSGTTWNTLSSTFFIIYNGVIPHTFSANNITPVNGYRYRYKVTSVPHIVNVYSANITTTQTYQTTGISASLAVGPYWTTGSLSKNILTGSQFTSTLYSRVQSGSATSGYNNNNIVPFIIQSNDEVRFEGDESQLYSISSVLNPIDSGSGGITYLFLNKDIVDGTNLDSFFIRRMNEDPNSIILNMSADSNGSGFLFPQYPTKQLSDNFSNIVKSLKEKNIIP